MYFWQKNKSGRKKQAMKALTILYQGIDYIQQAICMNRLNSLQNVFYNNCDKNNKDVADRIRAISWNYYKIEMKQQLESILYSNNQDIKAIYYEYDPDNNWEGTIFACHSYNDLNEDDDWACDWTHSLQSPVIPDYTNLDIDLSLKTEQSAWILLYAILVLTMTYTDIVFQLHSNLPFCIGFHDQSPITRCNCMNVNVPNGFPSVVQTSENNECESKKLRNKGDR